MDDSETVCPLCCEELDISDQQFFPCKCGYQVCMWCWHRIREQETGLCPACRTPYGNDPHEFSAVDVEEVLKANKEKAAAEKREKERLKEEAAVAAASACGDGGDALLQTGQMDLPKDRSSLINIRVIRRNLVYAVGLPPSISNEDTLRKAEYFGQYGKVAKIVLNRTNVTSADPRRASASAYVTFVHKEDTLACLLALDGFFIDGRNIRASYGTSKYCSAFIKNVRCNNPECTYLHCMGDAEDTFTKQEIQAGYVTSGRDVLARQQQIVAQALIEKSGFGTRRKVGGGGPSGTGKASTSPVFPPPCFDEPLKSSSASLVPLPAPVSLSRSVSVGLSSTGTATAAVPFAPASATQFSRSVSMSASSMGSTASAGLATRKGVIGAPTATAASVVAGMHSSGNVPETPSGPTLTPLTPLKRTIKGKSSSSSLTSATNDGFDLPQKSSKLSSLRNGQKGITKNVSTAPTSPSSSVSSSSAPNAKVPTEGSNDSGVGSIGGTAISIPVSGLVGSSLFGSSNVRGNPIAAQNRETLIDGGSLGGSGMLGGQPLSARTSCLGGEIFTGQISSRSDSSIIGGEKDRWSSAAPGYGRSSSLLGSGGSHGIGGSDLWGNEPGGIAAGIGRAPGVIGGIGNNFGSIGSQRPEGASLAPVGSYNAGSSALASMLGINLPTGSGSLRESSTRLWNGPASSQAPAASGNFRSAVGPGVIGSAPGGGIPIRGSGTSSSSGGFGASSGTIPLGNGASSDIALLQSLLPGVHITSGNARQPAAPGGFGSVGGQAVGGFNLGASPQGGSWNGGSAVGGSARMTNNREQQSEADSIW